MSKPSCADVSGGIDDEVRYDFIWSRGKRPTECDSHSALNRGSLGYISNIR